MRKTLREAMASAASDMLAFQDEMNDNSAQKSNDLIQKALFIVWLTLALGVILIALLL